MTQEVTTKDLVEKIDDLARLTAEGFANTATKTELAELGSDIDRRLGIVEHKLDRVLYDELDRHERWIKLLADKVGVQLSR